MKGREGRATGETGGDGVSGLEEVKGREKEPQGGMETEDGRGKNREGRLSRRVGRWQTSALWSVRLMRVDCRSMKR